MIKSVVFNWRIYFRMHLRLAYRLRTPALQHFSGLTPASRGDDGTSKCPTAHRYSFWTYSCCPLGAAHEPVECPPGLFLLVAQRLASPVTAMSTQGRPVTVTRNDVALEYVGTCG